MKVSNNTILIEKNDLISFANIEGNKPEIRLRDGRDEKEIRLRFDHHDTFEYFSLKMDYHTQTPP